MSNSDRADVPEILGSRLHARRLEFLYKLMLWSLGIAAVLGVLAVLAGSFEVVGRVAATAVLTAACSAILWKMANAADNCQPLVCWVADVGCAGFFLFGLFGIWGPDGEMLRNWLTAFAVLTTTGLSAGGFWQDARPKWKWTGRVIGFVAGPVLLCWLYGIWVDGGKHQEIGACGFALLSWSVPAALSLTSLAAADPRPWRWVGVVAAVVGLGLTVDIIFDFDEFDRSYKAAFVSGSVCALVVHALLTLHAPLKPGQLWIRRSTWIATAVCALLVNIAVVGELEDSEMLTRLIVASAILAAAGTIAVAFIGKREWQLQRVLECPPETGGEQQSVYTSIQATCPACQHTQALPLGNAQCGRCGLRFEIRIL